MMRATALWPTPTEHLIRHQPDTAQLYFSPAVLQDTARRFIAGFDGLVTYAVKANPGEEVLGNLISTGISGFDVASPAEMAAVHALGSGAVLHYNNPVRSRDEVAHAIALGVRSFSVDCAAELDKLWNVHPRSEIAVRLALPVPGAAYDFGSKFGATPAQAVTLLRRVVAMGLAPSMTFHPGTQCADPAAWGSYIAACAGIAREAGVTLARLNVGGGFPARRGGQEPELERIFNHVHAETARCFGPAAPALVCEPGRAMVADAFSIAARVKALRPDGSVFLNDGLYGGLAEARDMEVSVALTAIAPGGTPRSGAPVSRVAFGPTCDSVDRLPGTLALPSDLAEGDYLVFAGMGAYSRCLSTGFNGYGLGDPVTVARL